jgi:AcrR family transcriptional regulator
MTSKESRTFRKPASRYHHGDLRRALLQDAARTIAAQGVEALTLREVGRRLGVSRTALYRHFSDKTALLAAVARDGFQRFAHDLQAGWAEAPGTLRGFELMGHAYIRFALSHQAHYRVMFGDYAHLCEKDPELYRDGSASFAVLTNALVSLQNAGLVRRDDPVLLAQYVWGIVHGIAMLAINGQLGSVSESERLDALTDLALRRVLTGIEANANDLTADSQRRVRTT